MGWLAPVVRVGCLRRRASVALEEWSPSSFGNGQNPAYRPSGIFLKSMRSVVTEFGGFSNDIRCLGFRGCYFYASVRQYLCQALTLATEPASKFLVLLVLASVTMFDDPLAALALM